MKSYGLILGLVVFLQNPATGAVVSNTNIGLLKDHPYQEFEYMLGISTSDIGGSFILLDRDGENLIYQAVDLGTGSLWYFANYGDVFNAATINEGKFLRFWGDGYYSSSSWGANAAFHVGYGDFYMGVNTGFLDSPDYEIFGWAHLRNTEAGLELLGSGVSYDYPGIIIGTTMVPEPSSLAMAAVFVVGWVISGRSRAPRFASPT